MWNLWSFFEKEEEFDVKDVITMALKLHRAFEQQWINLFLNAQYVSIVLHKRIFWNVYYRQGSVI